MTPQLYFVYDSHCPWSYACLPLINEIAKSYPEMELHLWHAGHYTGGDSPSSQQVDRVKKEAKVHFCETYDANSHKNSLLMANLMAWLVNKQPNKALDVLNAVTQQHFMHNAAMDSQAQLELLLSEFKLSPPNKVFKATLSNDALHIIEDIEEIQTLIGMRSFPILLLANGDNAVLLDHSHYLQHPEAIVEAIKQELHKKR